MLGLYELKRKSSETNQSFLKLFIEMVISV